MNIFFKLRRDRWIWYVLTPLLIVVISLLLEKQYRNIQHSNNVSNKIEHLGYEINETNFSLALNNIKSLSSMPCVNKTVLGQLPIDNVPLLSALSVIRNSSGAEMAYVMDSTGRVVASTLDSITGISFTGKNFSFRPYFINLKLTGEMVFYPALGVISKKRGLYLSYPVIDSSKVIGVVVLKTGIANYNNTLNSYDIPCAIVSEDGIVYASNNESWIFKSTYNLSESKLKTIKESRQFDAEELPPLGYDFSKNKIQIGREQYVVKAASVFNGRWHVVGLFKKAKFNVVVFVIILLSFLLILSGFYYANSISVRLIQMRKWSISRERYSRRVFKQIESALYLNNSDEQNNWANLTKTITESGAEVLDIDRSAVWLFNDDYSELLCDNLFIKSTKEHTKGETKTREKFPRYFSVLLRDEVIMSSDVELDSELGYELKKKLNSHNITSIIHIPIFQQDKAIGVVCFEHVGVKMEWNIDEQLFCERLVNSIALFLAIQQKQEIANALKNSNKSLIAALEEARRSKELERANALLAMQKNELLEALQKLKETQLQLVQYEKMASVGVLTTGIAHEVNNPLNFIQGGKTALELFICDNYPDKKEDFKPMIEMIESGISRASKIVNSLNHFNRNSDAFNEECNLHSIIENCIVIMHSQNKHRIDVETNFSDESFRLLGNEGKLHQVFLNILINAEQAIENKGLIIVSSKLRNDVVEIIIKDNGVGIIKENLNKIADPFFTTKDPGKGTGLGASIAFSIIQEHNGYMEYQSDGVSGTTVKVSLPVVNEIKKSRVKLPGY